MKTTSKRENILALVLFFVIALAGGVSMLRAKAKADGKALSSGELVLEKNGDFVQVVIELKVKILTNVKEANDDESRFAALKSAKVHLDKAIEDQTGGEEKHEDKDNPDARPRTD